MGRCGNRVGADRKIQIIELISGEVVDKAARILLLFLVLTELKMCIQEVFPVKINFV